MVREQDDGLCTGGANQQCGGGGGGVLVVSKGEILETAE